MVMLATSYPDAINAIIDIIAKHRSSAQAKIGRRREILSIYILGSDANKFPKSS